MLNFRVHGTENASTSDAPHTANPVNSRWVMAHQVHSVSVARTASLAQGKFGPKGMCTLFYLVQKPARTALLGIASKESLSCDTRDSRHRAQSRHHSYRGGLV